MATVRIPVDLMDRASAEAERLGYPVAWVLAHLIREGLDALPDNVTLTRNEDADEMGA